MKFAYEDLSDEQFETLVIMVCQRILGVAVQCFATGPDGGRDGKFIGTAEHFPSKAAPWTGTIIIQAKHTNGLNRNFAESDFYSPDSKTSQLAIEIPRIKKLRVAKNLDYYMLFANRRLAANCETEIQNYLAKGTGLNAASIRMFGLEQLELWLKQYPEIPKLANLDLVDSPLLVSPDDLSDIIQAFARQRDDIASAIDIPPVPRVSYAEKNKLNNMSDEYAKEFRRRHLKYAELIHTFLASPENMDIQELYESVVEEFQMRIIAHRREYQTFDRVIEHILKLLFDRDAVLRQRGNKPLTRAMLFYMYWNCDIGEVSNAQAV